MKTRRIHHIFQVVLILILALILTGCLESPRAKWNNSSTEKLLFKAKDMEAEKYASQEYQQANSELERSKRLLGQGDAKGAFEASKTAKTLAKQAFDKAIASKSAADFNTAEQKFKVATVNEGKRTNPALYEKIQQNLEQARKYQARTKKNHAKIIEYSELVINDVKTLLAEVTKLAENEVGEATRILDDAKRNEAETRAPDAWIKADALVKEAVDLKNKEEYFKAIEKAKEAQNQAQDANQLAMESKAREELGKAERLIAGLRDLDAQKYVPAKYNLINGNYQRAQQAFQDKDYRIAIDVAGMVQSLAPDALQEAEKLKLKDQLKIARQDIDILKLNDAEKYAPTFLSEAEAALEDGEKAYEAQEYERVKEIHTIIREKIDLANARLSDRAKIQISDADIAIKDAEDSGALLYANNILNRAQEFRTEAQRLLDNKRYRDAILMAQNTITKAQEAKTAAIKRRAELNLIESEKAISVAIGEGAELYATEDIQEARDLLKQGRDALQGGQYTKAQELSSQVKNKVDDSYTTMREKAVEQINETRNSIDNASDKRYMVARYPNATEKLNSAQQKMNEAESLLKENKYSKSIETAVDGRATAIEAKNLAIRQQIIDRTPSVQYQIEEAKIAGAYNYAIEEYDKALASLKSSQDNLAAGRYDLALDDFDAAENHAETALKSRIIEARDMIESAKAIGAWDHDPVNMQTAVTQLDAAQALLKNRRYPESLAAANTSIDASAKAQSITKDRIFIGEINQIHMLINNARMAAALIPEKVNALRNEVNAFQSAYTDKNIQGDEFTSAMEKLASLKTQAANLDSEANATRNELNKQIESRINDAKIIEAEKFAEKELTEAENNYREAIAAFSREDYVAAKTAYDAVLAALDRVEVRRLERDYKEALAVQLVHLNKAMADFNNVLKLSPLYMKEIKDGKIADTYKELKENFHNVVTLSAEFFQASKGDTKQDPYRGLQGKLTAGKFRQITTETFVRIKALKPPPTLKDLHQKAVQIFEEAKLAGEYFDKFGYHQEYTPETRDDLIEKAFTHLKTCWVTKHEVETFLQGPNAQESKPDTFWYWAFESKKDAPGESFLEWVKGN